MNELPCSGGAVVVLRHAGYELFQLLCGQISVKSLDPTLTVTPNFSFVLFKPDEPC